MFQASIVLGEDAIQPNSPHDIITIQLVEPEGHPAMVRIAWPMQSSIVDPKVFPDTAAAVAQLFARAHIVLAAIRAERRL